MGESPRGASGAEHRERRPSTRGEREQAARDGLSVSFRMPPIWAPAAKFSGAKDRDRDGPSSVDFRRARQEDADRESRNLELVAVRRHREKPPVTAGGAPICPRVGLRR